MTETLVMKNVKITNNLHMEGLNVSQSPAHRKHREEKCRGYITSHRISSKNQKDSLEPRLTFTKVMERPKESIC